MRTTSPRYIDASREATAKLAKAFRVTDKFVYLCLTYRKNSETARKIRYTAVNEYWKTQARMTLAAKVDLTPENNLLLTPEEFGRRGQFYFGLSAFEGFEFTDAFTG